MQHIKVHILHVLIFSITFYLTYIVTDTFSALKNEYIFIFSISLSTSLTIYFLKKKLDQKLNILLAYSSILFALFTLEILLSSGIERHIAKKKREYIINQIDKKHSPSNALLPPALPKQIPPSTLLSYKLNDFNIKGAKLFPVSPVSNKNTWLCHEAGKTVTYFSDRYGFNNPDNIYQENIQNIFIGDSFTNGACVENQDSLVTTFSKISGELSLNFGVSGSGPLLEWATLREFFPKGKNIKNIFLIFYEGNDFSNLETELKNPILKNYLDFSYTQNLNKQEIKLEIDKQVEKKIQQFLTEKKEDLQREVNLNQRRENSLSIKFLKPNSLIKLTKLRALGKRIIADSNNNLIFRSSNILSQILDNFVVFSEQKKSNFYFVFLPDPNRYTNNVYRPDYKKNLFDILKKYKIKTIDFSNTVLKKENFPKFYSSFGGHYSPEGYKKLSIEIKKSLIEFEKNTPRKNP